MATPQQLSSSGGPLFGRKWRIRVLTRDNLEIILSESPDPDVAITGNATVSPLRCTFRVEKNYGHYLQTGEVTVYNLNKQTETEIIRNGQQVLIEAGYEDGPYGLVFQGNIRQPIRGKESDGVTYFLRLLCIDSDDALNLGFCNFTLPSGQDARSVALQCARSSYVPFQLNINHDGMVQQKSSRGVVVFGAPKQHLRTIAQDNNASFYFDDGQAYISALQKNPQAVAAVEVKVGTGMIGTPQQIDKGVSVRVLMNPQIRIDHFIHLRQDQDGRTPDIQQAELALGQTPNIIDLDGLYRVIKITTSGDTRGNDWYYDLETVAQLGFLPAMLTDQYQSGF